MTSFGVCVCIIGSVSVLHNHYTHHCIKYIDIVGNLKCHIYHKNNLIASTIIEVDEGLKFFLTISFMHTFCVCVTY